MKKWFALMGMALGISAQAQFSFTDNFDSYTAGAYLCVSNNKWKTWDDKPGTATDIQVSSAKAYSGTQSLYISSVNGGPQDIILPFPSAYASGSLEIKMMMYVDNGKKGYFNVQGEPTPGKEWSYNFETNNDDYISTNGNNVGISSEKFRLNSWNKITLKVDLNANRWVCMINDSAPVWGFTLNNKAGGINFYAMANSSYYLDDIEVTHTPYSVAGIDLGIAGVETGKGLPGQTFTPRGWVRNLGSNAISSYTVEFSYNGNTYTSTVNGKNIASLGYDTFVFNQAVPFDLSSRFGTFKITARNGQNSDDVAANDVANYVVEVVNAAPGKFVISEEGTGTWCGWCPRGAVMLDDMHKKYKGYFQGIAVHNGANDPMLVPVYDNGMKSKIAGYPSALVDRMSDIDPSAIETEFLKRVTVAPNSSVKAGTEYNAGTRELKVSLTTRFLNNVNGNYRIVCVLLEDSLYGTSSGWAQANYYSGGSRGVMGGFEKLPNPVPANKMVYNHVARWIAPGFNGQPNSFTSTVMAGDSFVHNFIFSLPWGWRSEKMHVVGFVLNPAGEIDNGTSVDFKEGEKNGFVNGTQVKVGTETVLETPEWLKLYPNPASNFITVGLSSLKAGMTTLRILDMQGKLVYQTSQLLQGDAQYQMQIPLDGLSKGVYMLECMSADARATGRFVKE